MGNGRAWTRDIGELEALARTEMIGVKDDIAGCAGLVARISVEPVAFGDLEVSHRVARTHEQARERYEEALRVSSERVEAVAAAIAAIAEHYRALDEHYG